MKPLRDLRQNMTKVIQSTRINATRTHVALLFILVSMVWSAKAQTVTWSDSFVKLQKPTEEQCKDWTRFLDELGNKSFVSVKISGSFDETGKVITDPVAANALANLLYTRTTGTVTSGNNYWTVTMCGEIGACGSLSVALSVNGNKSNCDCNDKYALRPHSTNEDWGGINTLTCDGPSQSMTLEFNSGVSITASGPTTFCEGGSVMLTAKSDYCKESLTYEWSNGAATESITVSEPGSYSVTVRGANGCEGVSSPVSVSISEPSVSAGSDAVFCTDPVQLTATGTSTGGSGQQLNTVCIYNSTENSIVETDDCTFTTNVCDEGATFFVTASHSASVSYENPVELRFHVYYSAFAKGTLRFKLNDKELGSYFEDNPKGTCETSVEGKFPRSFSYSQSQIKDYWLAGENTLTVQIESTNKGFLIAGIVAEVVTSSEKYTWSPIAGLDDPTISNPVASPTETTTYMVSYSDAYGCVATDDVIVSVDCSTGPVARCKEVEVEVQDGCEAVVEAIAFNDGSEGTGQLTFSVDPAGPYPVGITAIKLTVTDETGQSSSCETLLTVLDLIAPTVTAKDTIVANSAGMCSATVDLVAPKASDNCSVASITHDQLDNIFLVGETLVTWTVTDPSGNLQTATQKVIVTNADPVINSVTASSSTVAINNSVTITTNYTDNNVSLATIDWGDLSIPDVIESPLETFDASHTYSQVGWYTVTVTLTDHCARTATYVYDEITVFDNTATLTGDGWYESIKGWYLKDKRAAGKAKFHFDASYEKNATIPSGYINFKFKEGNIDFKSTALNALVVMSDRAFLTGAGTLNRVAGYSILISAVDIQLSTLTGTVETTTKKTNKVDKIRVRIADPWGNVIYDTQLGDPKDAVAQTDIGAGSIVINNSGSDTFTQTQETVASFFGSETTSVYPNPFVDNVNVQYNSSSTEDVVIQLMDLSGKVVASGVYSVSETGNYTLSIPASAKQGMYILTIRQGQRIEYLRILSK